MMKLLMITMLVFSVNGFAAQSSDTPSSQASCCKDGRYDPAACNKTDNGPSTDKENSGTSESIDVNSP